jgi:hypothetical protein
MNAMLARATLLTLMATTLFACRSNHNCGIPEQWSQLVNHGPSAHAQMVVRVSLAGPNGIRWNGVRVNEETLLRYLRTSATEFPLPFIEIQADSQDCEENSRILGKIYSAYPCRDGVCGLQMGLR